MTSEMDQEGKAEPAEDDEFDGEIDDVIQALAQKTAPLTAFLNVAPNSYDHPSAGEED